jgi:hypothetical protein
MKTMEIQFESHDLDPRESSWEVEGVICKIHRRWEVWFAKVILQITPPTSSERPVGSTSCDSDWNFHSLHGEVGFHLIGYLLPNAKEWAWWKVGYIYFLLSRPVWLFPARWVFENHPALIRLCKIAVTRSNSINLMVAKRSVNRAEEEGYGPMAHWTLDLAPNPTRLADPCHTAW